MSFGIPGDDPAQPRRLVRGSNNLRFVQATVELSIDNVRRLNSGRPVRNRITPVRRY